MNKPTDVQDVIKTQIQQYYSVIAQERENRVKTRNWAITAILAYIAILGSGKIYATQNIASGILISIIIIFWITEGFHQSWVLVNEERVQLLEHLLSKDTLPASLPSNLHYISGYNTVTLRTKIRTFLRGTFTAEPIVFFYFSLIALSYLFVHFVYPVNLISPH